MELARILIVEDDLIVAEGIRNRLEDSGHAVVAVEPRGENVLALVAEHEPDLILMDIMLKGRQDGVETARQVRMEFNIPILYLTAYSDDTTITKAKISEPYMFLVKPVHERELESNIQIALYRHKIENRLANSEQRYRNLVESAEMPIVEISRDGIILLVNHKAAELFNASSEMFRERRLQDVLNRDQAENVLTMIRQVMDQGESVSGTYKLPVGNSERMFSIAVKPVAGDADIPARVQIIGHDLTDMHLVDMNRERLNRLDNATALMNGIAADFNQYLTAIVGNLTLARLDMPEGASRLHEYLERAEKAALWSRDMIEKLLVLVPDDDNQMVRLDCAALIDETVQALHNFYNVSIKTDIAPEIWRVFGNHSQLGLALTNILLNAVQHSDPDSPITVSVRNCRIEKGADHSLGPGKYITVGVANHGRFADEDEDWIFQPYASGNIGGTGLGLTVANTIIRKHGGIIEPTAKDGQVVFIVYLPCAGEKIGETRKFKAAPQAENQAHILLVDDDRAIRDTIGRILRQSGYNTTTVATGEEALEICRTPGGRPELMLLDLVLEDEGIDGFSVLRALKADEDLQGIPVIIISGQRGEEDKVLGLELGAVDYITKPFMPNEMLARLRNQLRSDKVKDHVVKLGHDVAMDTRRHQLHVAGETVEITPTEYKIMEILTRRPGWVFSQDQILDHLWGNEKAVTEKTVVVHISNLRKKLGPAGECLRNIRGAGYTFKIPES